MTETTTSAVPEDDADSRVPQSCDKPELPRELENYLLSGIAFLSLSAVCTGVMAVLFLFHGEFIGVVTAFVVVDVSLLVRSWVRERHRIQARRDRLASVGKELPVTQVHVIDDAITHSILFGKKPGFRIRAQFRGTDGLDYEAYSDMYERDPSTEIDLGRLRVLFDEERPLQSLLDPTTAPASRWSIR